MSEESSEFTQNEDDETGENGVENLTGGNNQPTGELRIEEVSESRRRKTSPVSEKNLTEDRSTSSKRISRRAQLFQRVAKEVIAALGGKPPQPQQLPRREVQFEDVELVGKKVTARSR
ncbi:hypothetical protein MUP77_04895 [Candidatus Bathyarchaeota archaeon]|nr:hypothetical protein [Candidatus Bathyarchaeota archaeon]